MDANFHFNNPFPSAAQPQHLIDIPSPSDNSNVAPTCVHIREEDSHCEQCRQQIRSMSRSMQLTSSPTLGRQSTDLHSVGAGNLRERRRASHCPSASDTSMSSSFSSSPGETTAPVLAHRRHESHGSRRFAPATRSSHRGSPASRSLSSILHSSSNAATNPQLNQSFGAV
jgi:hypothetical protein